MKIMKILLTIIAILFAAFGLFKVLSFDIVNPIISISLATLLLLRGIEYKNNRDKSGFIRKGQILRSTPNTAPLTCGACYSTQPEGLLTTA